jgi:glycosyltransferase involved in cell wall biosynthesis
MANPMVSVIIPTFNRENYVTKAIDSVLAQTYPDYEIVVVDDGSTDNTKEVIRKYKDKIRYLYQKNQGVSSARNSGIKASRGEWIAFLDSDDEWFPDYLLYQVDQIKKTLGPRVYITNALTLSEDGTISNYFEQNNISSLFKGASSLTINKPLLFVIKYRLASLITVLMKKDIVIEAGKFDERLSILEDYDLFARMSLLSSFVFINKELVYIIRRKEAINNLTSQLYSNSMRCRRASEIIYKHIRKNPGLSIKERLTVNRILSANQRALGNLVFNMGKLSEARHHYKEAMLICPSIRSVPKYFISLFPGKIASSFIGKGSDDVPGEEMPVKKNN